MPIGVVEFRDIKQPDDRRGKGRVKKPFVRGTSYEISPNAVRTDGWGAISFADLADGLDIEYEEVGSQQVADVRRYPAVPAGVRRLLELHGCEHPGLLLDKFIYRSADQSFVKHALRKVIEVNHVTGLDSQWFRELRSRWLRLTALNQASSLVFRCRSVGPLTLHLARASALENAGICLHPLYGFAYLPGSGLKGMARSYAETVWLPVQSDQRQAWRQIEDVFGWATNPDRRRRIADPDHPAQVRRTDDRDPNSAEVKASNGQIVFHDAWPEAWPELIVDIVNNHHPHYYGVRAGKVDQDGKCDECRLPPDDPNAHPPGDWENPVPVYFLAVKPGTTFTFCLSKRRANVSDNLLKMAREWLLGALCHLGAGAKTAAGYGAFKPVDGQTQPLRTEMRATFETTLELVTPAFLAGADQQAEDCDLRSAALRGLLRWWWRTMHAGFVDVRTLRALEAAIWGDTRSRGAVDILVERVSERAPQPFDKRSKANFTPQQKSSGYGIPRADPRRTTQGLWYLSYGMDEGNPPSRRQRYYLEPGARWRLRVITRPARFFSDRGDLGDSKRAGGGKPICISQVLDQVKAALWLLCHFGGIGSKARKGFGSLAADGLEGWSPARCTEVAMELRRSLGLSTAFDDGNAASPSLHQMLAPVEVAFSWPNVWDVLDQVGFAYQAFAKRYARKEEKRALGLPRRIGRPAQGSFNPTPPVTANGRHSSPVHIHVAHAGGKWIVRAAAFPAAHLPDLRTSRSFLEKFLKHLKDDLTGRARLSPPDSPSPQSAARGVERQCRPATKLPRAGEQVEAMLLEERTKKGGWKARHLESGLAGPVVNSGDVPVERKAGDRVTLIVTAATPTQISFRYPTASDERRAQVSGARSRGGRGDRKK